MDISWYHITMCLDHVKLNHEGSGEKEVNVKCLRDITKPRLDFFQLKWNWLHYSDLSFYEIDNRHQFHFQKENRNDTTSPWLG